MLELPPCWPTSYQSKRRASTISERPNVIYVGRTDLSGKTVHVADDVRPLMSQLLVAGIELHHGASKETDDGHPLRKPFDYRPVPELVAMMSGFDAGLVSYNATACKRTERLSLTVPDRLITTVAAGITVAIPKVGYAAAKTYLSKYPAVIQFGSAAELFEVLRERTYVAQLNEEAWLARPRYAAESHRENLRRFLNSIAGGLDLEGPNNLY